MRDEAERTRHAVAQRPVAGDDERQPARRLDELEDALLRREPAGEEDVRRLVRLARPSSGTSTPLGITRTSRAPSSRAAAASSCEAQIASRARAQDPPGERRRAPGELDVGAPELDDERLARSPPATSPAGSQWAWTRSASRAARRADARERGEHRRQQQPEPGPAAEVADDAVAVRDPEVAERERRDDLDLDARPRAAASTASATKRPTTSSGERG